MTQSLIRHLIVKDLQLHRAPLLVAVAGGALSLAILPFGGMLGLFGIIAFFTSMIVLANILPQSTIVSERKNKTLAFVMSLPISSIEYTTAKIVGTVGMFMIPWLALVTGAVSLILGRKEMPNGLIPVTFILAAFPLVGFCLTTAVALVGESEGWSLIVGVACNISYTFAWILVAGNATIRSGFGSPVAVWSPTVLTVLGCELAAITVILALTLYLQSRKRDFV
jgi:ABC-2 type transport system permease protein